MGKTSIPRTPTDNTLIVDPGSKSYFIMTPFIIDDMDLTPHGFRLYIHLKRRAGEKGECWENTRNLAAACHMSTGKISEAKKELVEKGLISIRSVDRDGGQFSYHVITINDIWLENMLKYSGMKSHSHDEQENTSTCSRNQKTRSQGETKDIPLEENPIISIKDNAPAAISATPMDPAASSFSSEEDSFLSLTRELFDVELSGKQTANLIKLIRTHGKDKAANIVFYYSGIAPNSKTKCSFSDGLITRMNRAAKSWTPEITDEFTRGPSLSSHGIPSEGIIEHLRSYAKRLKENRRTPAR
jgi:hypothetical protein